LAAKIGADNFFPNMNTALNAIHARTHKGETELKCPLKTVVSAQVCSIEKET
jgi:hypothetical protein